ncbi:MAG: hypothetical protein SPL40_02235 [Erysipelotrichaceae bacterium]|nr:hypothetical protein [Erysipelotrichaceae bacterium]
MTEKERREVFNDPDNWFPSSAFPSNGMIRVLMFEFYGAVFYKLQIYTDLFYWGDDRKPSYRNDWETKFVFCREGGLIEIIGATEVKERMKEAERKENE